MRDSANMPSNGGEGPAPGAHNFPAPKAPIKKRIMEPSSDGYTAVPFFSDGHSEKAR